MPEGFSSSGYVLLHHKASEGIKQGAYLWFQHNRAAWTKLGAVLWMNEPNLYWFPDRQVRVGVFADNTLSGYPPRGWASMAAYDDAGKWSSAVKTAVLLGGLNPSKYDILASLR